MKNNPTKQQILEKIKERCPELMELSFGCEVFCVHNDTGTVFRDRVCESIGKLSAQYCHEEGLSKNHVGAYIVERGYAQPEARKIKGLREVGNLFELNEIIGHPPQLQHLLTTFNKTSNNNDSIVHFDGENLYFFESAYDDMSKKIKYDLTKSVEENLDNKELCEFIGSVLL